MQADDKNNEFMLSFNYRASENPNAITYFAFTYPFSYTDLQNYLKKIDAKMSKQNTHLADDIYYHRECAIKTLEGRRLDILTISSYYNKSVEREAKIKDLFPEKDEERPFKFYDKKVKIYCLNFLFYVHVIHYFTFSDHFFKCKSSSWRNTIKFCIQWFYKSIIK